MQVFTKLDYMEGFCSTEEVGQPWEPRWGYLDAQNGDCQPDKIGTRRAVPEPAPEPETTPHHLLDGLDPDDPDLDRKIVQRMFRSNPDQFMGEHGTAIVNKIMDIAVKDERPDKLPPVGDRDAWKKIGADVVKMVERCDSPRQVASVPLMLYVFVKAKCDPVAALEAFAEAEATRQTPGA